MTCLALRLLTSGFSERLERGGQGGGGGFVRLEISLSAMITSGFVLLPVQLCLVQSRDENSLDI